MVPTRNSLTNYLPYAGIVSGLATVGSSPTVTLLPGVSSADDACVSITRGGVGVYTIVVTNFRGPNGVAVGSANSTLSGVLIAASTGSYTNSTMSMQFGSMLHDGTYSDSNFTFTIKAT